jgi:hypothetical protein
MYWQSSHNKFQQKHSTVVAQVCVVVASKACTKWPWSEYQWGSLMCKSIQLTGISMFIVIITSNYSDSYPHSYHNNNYYYALAHKVSTKERTARRSLD